VPRDDHWEINTAPKKRSVTMRRCGKKGRSDKIKRRKAFRVRVCSKRNRAQPLSDWKERSRDPMGDWTGGGGGGGGGGARGERKGPALKWINKKVTEATGGGGKNKREKNPDDNQKKGEHSIP